MSRYLNRIKSVRTKLLAGFMIVVAITAFVGYSGINSLGHTNEAATHLYDEAASPLGLLARVRGEFLMARVNAYQHLLLADAGDKEAKEVELFDHWANVDKYFAEFSKDHADEEGAAEFAEAWPEYKRIVEEEYLPPSRRSDIPATLAAAAPAVETWSVADAAITQLIDGKISEGKVTNEDANDVYQSTRRNLLVMVLAALAIAFALGFGLARAIVKPLKRSVEVLDRIADGDLTQRLDIASRDEVGQMADALNRMVDKTGSVVRSIRDNAQTLASSSEELSATAQQMGASAEETSAQAGAVASAAEQVSANVQTVATGAEEMGASIKEIAGSATDAAKVAQTAVGVADQTNQTVAKLGDSSAEIGEVIKVITSIAEQTNLLALNATIEAARAGEAGKGFAVVANEVKELAKETAKATEDIGGKIVAIQADAKAAADAIGEISGVINQINDIQSTIASAVEEQTATTNEISRNVTEAATGSTEIASNITGVAQAAQDTSSGATNTLTAARDLARLGEQLRSIVSQFSFDSGTDGGPASPAASVGGLEFSGEPVHA